MFSANFQNLLDPLEHEVPQSVGNTRKIGRGVRINTNDSARLDIAWCVRQSADYATYGRDGRFVEFRIADVENVTRKTLSLIDSRPPSTGENHHFLYVARAERPTKVLVSVAGRCDPDAKFADLSRTNQAIGEVPTALMVTVPAPSDPASALPYSDYRFNITCKEPGALVIQLLDVRYCVT